MNISRNHGSRLMIEICLRLNSQR